MTEIKLRSDQPQSMAERVAKRLQNSGAGANPDWHIQKGDGPTRTHTNGHHSAGHVALPVMPVSKSEGR